MKLWAAVLMVAVVALTGAVLRTLDVPPSLVALAQLLLGLTGLMLPYLRENFGNAASSSHALGRAAADAVGRMMSDADDPNTAFGTGPGDEAGHLCAADVERGDYPCSRFCHTALSRSVSRSSSI